MMREYLMAFGLWLLVAGLGSYQRYMTDGLLVSAVVALALSLVGAWGFARGLKVEEPTR